MGRTLRYHPLFSSDALSAYQWYENKQENLGADFLARVRKAIDQLVEDPERRSLADYGVRYWPVGRFPYVVFYDLIEAEILVLGSCIRLKTRINGSQGDRECSNHSVACKKVSGFLGLAMSLS